MPIMSTNHGSPLHSTDSEKFQITLKTSRVFKTEHVRYQQLRASNALGALVYRSGLKPSGRLCCYVTLAAPTTQARISNLLTVPLMLSFTVT